jgi:hypothetical protein
MESDSCRLRDKEGMRRALPSSTALPQSGGVFEKDSKSD